LEVNEPLRYSLFILKFVALFAAIGVAFSCRMFEQTRNPFLRATTLAGLGREFGEPFGIACDKNGNVFVSDGERGKIFRIARNKNVSVVAENLDTPSAMAFDPNGNLVVVDSGAHVILRVDVASGKVDVVAGTRSSKGFRDGDSEQALFNSPIGVAVSPDGKIYVADTYNDRIRMISDGRVSTLAGGERGFADGVSAKFDTPTSLAITGDGKILVADSANYRLRMIDQNGNVSTLAGNGDKDLLDSIPALAKFVQPTAVAIDEGGAIYVADGNAIRMIGSAPFPFVETISGTRRGFADGELRRSRFNRPSGLTFDSEGNLFIADSENQVVRIFEKEAEGNTATREEILKLQVNAEEFRKLAPARWCFDPPQNTREIAGTLGEIRGEIENESDEGWFHNGLDIVGGYGEKVVLIRDEKVLRPISTDEFGNKRELIRFPTTGYVHLRLGRDVNEKPFNDMRYQFEYDDAQKIVGLRIPRGTKFRAGETIGTLNTMYHTHLIAGRSGFEMNALDALVLPGLEDRVAPRIEAVSFYDQGWNSLAENVKSNDRISVSGRLRIVVNAYDQMNGNAARRKLGVYKVGYGISLEGENASDEIDWRISFARMPDDDAVRLVYAKGSMSGYTPETVFRYIATNKVIGENAAEEFLDTGKLSPGNYVLRIAVADFFSNVSIHDQPIEITR